ncbi:MAG TPA: sugar ABC transporter ATP-binding protein [Rhizomicrobium sp.]|nr:sugar ABC transporter ATP-binding protein [Rhizomicrobium sp.]
MNPLLELIGIRKRFPGVVALDDVSLSVDRGQVVALIGENGAGKSTLIKILGGIHQPDEGRVLVDGQPVSIRCVADAARLGIGLVHQELNDVDNLDAAGNLFLGREKCWAGPLKLIDRAGMARAAVPYLHRIGLDIDPGAPMRKLSLAQRQMVEIAKALSQDARILVLDEPTSSLTATETSLLLATIRDLAAQGVSVIYVSHRLGEISLVADRVVALRDGRNAGSLAREQINHDNMVRLMIGRDLRSFYVTGCGKRRDCRLRVRNLRTQARPAHAISFDAVGGEILGIAGLVGAGRSELAETIFGVAPRREGEILLDGRPVRIDCPRDAIEAGIYLATEDRRQTGLIVPMSVRENVTLPGLSRYARMGLVRRRAECDEASRYVDLLSIKTPSVDTRVMNLSGGTQQKVVLAKWLALKPKVLIVDEPTRGIDVGSRAEIYRLLRDLADQGVAIVVISSDLEEVLGVSDRIAVMRDGALAGILDREQFSEEAVMNLAFGKTGQG